MEFEKRAKFTRWCGRLIAAVILVLCVTLRDLLSWYHSFRDLSWQAATAIMLGYYLCVPGVLYALWSMDRLLGRCLNGGVFLQDNVRSIRGIRWCCGYVSLISLVCGVVYPPLLFLWIIMAFLALTVSVLERVMEAAVEIREENDLTV